MPPKTPFPTYPTSMRYDQSHILNDPAVDFRAFYPYTPNEVKHRKRTTSAQLKVLESVFKTDTKPNANRRNELAQQLDMTARGVQVWFQNRRAKEKSKSVKAVVAAAPSVNTRKDASPPVDSRLSSSSSSTTSPSARPSSELLKIEDSSSSNDCTADPRNSKPLSPPQLHVITDGLCPNGWEAAAALDAPPDSATSPTAPPLDFASDPYNLRRGSLPVNAFPQSLSDDEAEWFDPLSRRRSVDASLQRLAFNPYAHIARTKNSALFGPTFGVAPVTSIGRFNHRMPPYPSGRPSLPHFSSVPHVNTRRSSMDSRRLGLMLRQSLLSPGPPTASYINSRASLPDGQLYAVSSRSVGSPIPGPLPSPNFSFGAASTPSMTSPSSADSERNSPDSLRSFNFPDREEDGRLSPVYDNYSRFGSIVSIATSESSISSSYYPELGGPRVDQPLAPEMHNGGRRHSCSPGQYLEFPELDSTGQYALSENHPLGYPHEAYGAVRAHDIVAPEVADTKPYPSSTVHGQVDASNHGHDVNLAPASLPSMLPISRSSELAFAFQTQPEKAPSTTTPQDANHPYLAYGTSQASQPNSSDGAIHASESSTLMYQGGAPDDGTQDVYSTAYSSIPDGVYGQDGPIDPSLYQTYNDISRAAQSLDDNAIHGAEAYPHYV